MSEERYLKRMLMSMLTGTGLMLGILLGCYTLHSAESAWWPVTTDWTALSVTTEGNDLVVAGTMVKRRDCEYIQPPRARAVVSNRQYVLTSRSPTAGRSWAPDDDPQPFGPWVVHGAAGDRVEFFVTYRCHPLWLSNVRLGEVTS